MSADKLDLKDLDAENVHLFSKIQLRQWLTRNDVLLPKKEQDDDFYIQRVLKQLDEDRVINAHEKSFSVPSTKTAATPSKQERMFAGLRRPSPPRPRSQRGTPRKKAAAAAPAAVEEVDERAARREQSFIGMDRPAPPSAVKRGRSARAKTPERKKVAKKAPPSPEIEAKHDAVAEDEAEDADAAALRAAARRRRTLGASRSTTKKRAAVSRTASSRSRRSTMAPTSAAADKQSSTEPASPQRRRGRPKKAAPPPEEEQPADGSDEEADVDMADATDVEEEDEAPPAPAPRSPARRSARRGGGRPAAPPSPVSSRRSPRRRTTGSKRKQEVAELPEEPQAQPGADPISPPRSAHEVIHASSQDDSDLSESQPGTQQRKKAKTATASPRRATARSKRPVAATRTPRSARAGRSEKDSPQKAQKRAHPQTPQEARKGADPTKKEAKLSASGEKIKEYDFSAFPDRPSPPRPKAERGTPKKEPKVEPPSSSRARTRTPPSSAAKKRATRSSSKRAQPKQEKKPEEELYRYVDDKLAGNLGGGDDDESDSEVDARLGAALATPYKYNADKGKKSTTSSLRKKSPKKAAREDEEDRAREFLSASHILRQDFPEEAPRDFDENDDYGFDFDLDTTLDNEDVTPHKRSSLKVTRAPPRDLGISDIESDTSAYTDVSVPGKRTYRGAERGDAPRSALHESTRQPSDDLSFLEPAVRPKRGAKGGRKSMAKRVSARAAEVKQSDDAASHSFLDVDPNDSFVNFSNDGGARVAAAQAARGKRGKPKQPAAYEDDDAAHVPGSPLPPPEYLSDGSGVVPVSKATPRTTLSRALDSQEARDAHKKDFSIISFSELDEDDEEVGGGKAKPKAKAKPKRKSRAKPERRSRKFVEEEFFSDDDPVSPIKPAVSSPATVAANRRRAAASRSLSMRRSDRSVSTSRPRGHVKPSVSSTRQYPSSTDEELVSSDDEYKTTHTAGRDRRSTSVPRRRMVASDDYIDYTNSRGPSRERDLPAEYSPPAPQQGGGGSTGTSLAMMLVVVCVIFMFALTLIALSRGGGGGGGGGNHSYGGGGSN